MISIQDLEFSFSKNEPIFTGLNLELQAGRIYGLFGLNGAGKTTLLYHISGMLFPSSGSCMLLDSPSRDRNPEMLSELFLVPEQFSLPSMTGSTYIKTHAPFYPKFDPNLMDRVVNEFEIHPNKKISEMSYGQRKKFLIAFGLATKANVLLMDEPTNGLDIPSKSQFRKVIASIDHSERCIVISTHQVRDLGAMIDQVVVLKDGTIVFDQSIERINTHLRFEKVKSAETEGYIYGEESLGGLNAILASRSTQTHSEIDLELLFNGIISESEKFNCKLQIHSS